MDVKKGMKNIWLIVAAFFIGGCRIWEMNPLAVGYFTAVCLAKGSALPVYIALMAGLALRFPLTVLIRYGILMLGLGILMNIRSMGAVFSHAFAMTLFSGLFSAVINLAVYFFVGPVLSAEQIVLEGAIIFSSGMVYLYGIQTVTEDYAKITTENEAAISVTLLAASVVYGMPTEVFGGIVVAEAFGLFSILFAMYKFGFGLGMAWTVICGGIISGVTGDVTYLTTWLLVSIAAFALNCLIRGGRFAFALIFATIYFGEGLLFYDTLLDENSIKAVLSAVFFFLLAPARLLLQVDERIKTGELAENSPEWGRLVVGRIHGLASAFKRIEYTLASDVNTGIGFRDVGEIIDRFTNQLEQTVPLRKTIEAKIIEDLAAKDIQVKNLILLKNSEERYEVYITSRVRRGRLVTAEAVKKIVEKETGIRLMLAEESRNIVGRNYDIICLHERPAFECRTAVRRMSRFSDQVSGDNFYIGDILDGYKLLIIADGMGNGERASKDSSALIESLEELLAAGFNQEMSIRIVNSYLADKNRGESFATLDMLLLDMHTGCGRLYKQGAAATFIRRGEWMELIKSTSLPVGVIEGAVCEKCNKKFYNNDLIVMVSDGVLESIIFENKEDYMKELLMEAESDEPEDVVEYVTAQIKALSGNRLRDDATIIACKLVKSL